MVNRVSERNRGFGLKAQSSKLNAHQDRFWLQFDAEVVADPLPDVARQFATSAAVAPPVFTIASVCLDEIAAREPGSAKPRWMPACSISQAALSFTRCGLAQDEPRHPEPSTAPERQNLRRLLLLERPARRIRRQRPGEVLAHDRVGEERAGADRIGVVRRQHHALRRTQSEHGGRALRASGTRSPICTPEGVRQLRVGDRGR